MNCSSRFSRSKNWLKRAGEKVETNPGGVPGFDMEISPLFATNEEDFVSNWGALKDKPKIENKLYIQ